MKLSEIFPEYEQRPRISIGTWFRLNNGPYYILCPYEEKNHLSLINILTGSRWSNVVKVENIFNISRIEMQDLLGNTTRMTEWEWFKECPINE